MGARVVHFEIGCRDVRAAAKFYRELFDWSVTDEGDGASIDTRAANGIGGHLDARESDPYAYTIFYVAVDDIEETVLKAEALGGKTLLPILPLPSGRFTWIQDVEGNTIGLFQE